eukprot:jgi/Botrbrau1/7843/Bobra.9_2s0021.2
MLGDLAQDFTTEQLDMVFNKFEDSAVWVLADALKVVHLTRCLAKSDTNGARVERVLRLLWKMAMHPHAPPEVQQELPSVLTNIAYTALGKASMSDYIAKCSDQLRRGENVVVVVSMLTSLVDAVGSTAIDSGLDVAELEEQFHLMETVVSSLESHQHSMHSLLPKIGRHVIRSVEDQASLLAQAGFDFDHHAKATSTHLQFFIRMAETTDEPIGTAFCERIWDCLVSPQDLATPIIFQDVLQCYDFVRTGDGRILDRTTLSRLLDLRITSFPPQEMTSSTWQAVWMAINQVGIDEKKIKLDVGDDSESPRATSEGDSKTASLDLKGLPYAWEVFLHAYDGKVADDVRDWLVSVYTCLAPELQSQQAFVRQTMLNLCMTHLMGAAQGMLGVSLELTTEWMHNGTPTSPMTRSSPEYCVAAQTAARCLQLLKDMVVKCQGQTMPTRPVHAASSMGRVLRLELTGNISADPGRIRISSHTNAYLGHLRRQIATMAKSEAPRIRLFSGGRELNNDSLLLQEIGIVDGGHIMAMESPSKNSYSDPPPNVRAALDAASPALLLAQKPGLTGLLLRLADSGALNPVRMFALNLLDLLPTDLTVLNDLREALYSDAPAARLAAVLAYTDSQGNATAGPARFMYTLQALVSLLFPASAASGSSKAELQQRFVLHNCTRTLLQTLTFHRVQLADKDLEATRQLSRIMLHLLVSLSAEPQFPFCEKIQAQSDESRDEAVSMSIEGMESSKADSPSAGRPDPLSSVPEPGDVSFRDAGTAILQEYMAFYVKLCYEAGRGWGFQQSPRTPAAQAQPSGNMESLPPDADSQLSQDALVALESLLHRHPSLLPVLLEDAGARDMAIEGLLNSRHESVRHSTGRFLQRVAQDPVGHSWLLSTLRAAMPRADSRPRLVQNYYALFCDVVRGISEVLSEVQGSSLQIAQSTFFEVIRSLPDLSSEDEHDIRLQGKLHLLLALLHILDTSPGGSGQDTGLVKLLLTVCLFPEAWLELHTRGTTYASLSVEQLQVVMGGRCKTKSCRKAAFDLLLELMKKSLADLREGIDLIQQLHLNSAITKCLVSSFGLHPLHGLRPPGQFVGLKNGGATCYMNAIFQQVFMQPSIRHLVLTAPEDSSESARHTVFWQLQHIFGSLAFSNQESYSPEGFWQAFKDYDGEPLNVREHQDAYEFFTRLQDLVDQQMRAAGASPAMQTVMGGKFAQQIICRTVDFRSEKEEDFYQLSLEVRGKKNLEESLDFYVSGELMEGDNQYYCEEVGRKVDAVKRNCIKVLPHMLVIHLKRFEFDYETMNRWKIKDRFEFPESVNMYKYTVDGLAEREAAEAAARDNSANAAEPPTPPSASSSSDRAFWYNLKGIVVHSGTAFAGHYYSVIKDREGKLGVREPDQWYCFDDVSVEPWNIAHLEQDCFGGKFALDMVPEQEYDRPNSAYMLFYERAEATEPMSQAGHTDVQQGEADAGVVPMLAEPPSPDVRTVSESKPIEGALSVLAAVPVPNIPKFAPSVWEGIMESNVKQLQYAHLFDQEFFRFFRRLLVEAPNHVSQLGSHKLRRMDYSNSPTKSTASAGSGTTEDGMRTILRGPDSSLREEEQQLIVDRLLQLGLTFFFQVYLHGDQILREDVRDWQNLLVRMMESNPSGPRVVLSSIIDSGQRQDESSGEEVEVIDGSSNAALEALCDTEVGDVRRSVCVIFQSALQAAMINDGNGEHGNSNGSKARYHDVVAVSEALNFLKGSLNALLKKSPQLLVKWHFDCLLDILNDFVGTGTKHRTLMWETNLVHTLVNLAQRMASIMTRHFTEQIADTFRRTICILSPLIRRWDLSDVLSPEERSVSNPYRMPTEPYCAVKVDMYNDLFKDGMIAAMIEPMVICEEEVQMLLIYLQWNCKAATLHILHEVLKFFERPGMDTYNGKEEDLVAIFICPDRYKPGRIDMLLVGSGRNYGILQFLLTETVADLTRLVALKMVFGLLPHFTKEAVCPTRGDRRWPPMRLWHETIIWLRTLEQAQAMGKTDLDEDFHSMATRLEDFFRKDEETSRSPSPEQSQKSAGP